MFAYVLGVLSATRDERQWIIHAGDTSLRQDVHSLLPNQCVGLGTPDFHVAGSEFVSLSLGNHEFHLDQTIAFDAIKSSLRLLELLGGDNECPFPSVMLRRGVA